MSELGSQGGNSRQRLRDAELYALEEEVFGKQNLKYPLGVLYGHDEHGKQSYKIVSRAMRGALSDLSQLKSCLYGVPYSSAPDKNCLFTKRTIRYDDKGWTLVVHSTHNKENKLAVCAISVFDEGGTFLAYLFTTNDPLNFDNFNTFRGKNSDLEPQYKCVEQLVFCECKLNLGLTLAQNVANPQQALYDFAMTTSYIAEPIIDTLTASIRDFLNADQIEKLSEIKSRFSPEINRLSAEIKGMRPDDPERKDKRGEKSKIENEMNAELARKLREFIETVGAINFYNGYVNYFRNKLRTTHLAVPKDAYKFAGRGVLGVNGFLEKWEQIQLMCAVSARMQQLSVCKQERDLCAALIPRCVIEISEDDNIWAYSCGKKLDWFCTEDAKETMVRFIADATSFQDRFISELDSVSHDTQGAFKLLFSTSRELKSKFGVDSIHTLGLSERLIQSIWTRQIVFSDGLKLAIQDELSRYGITYVHYAPELEPNDVSALTTVSAIGC